jgi:hypothetical protein
MAATEFVQLVGIGDAQLTPDRSALIFTLKTTAGESRLAVRVEQLGNLVTFFASSAGAAERDAASRDPTRPPMQPKYVPIPATTVGFGRSSKPDTSIVGIGMGIVVLGFEVPSQELINMAAAVLQQPAPDSTGPKLQ